MTHTVHQQALAMARKYREARLKHKPSHALWLKLRDLMRRDLLIDLRAIVRETPPRKRQSRSLAGQLPLVLS